MKSPLLFQNQPVWQIADGENKVLVSPDHGARILRWERAGREIITWPESADWSKILKVRGGNPVLFPFVAVISSMAKTNSGATPPALSAPCLSMASAATPGSPSSMTVRTIPFGCASPTPTKPPPLFPFSFQFDVVVRLDPSSRLKIRFETTNRGEESLPYYAGHHFYFALPHAERNDWTLDLPCESWGRQSADGAIIPEEAKESRLHLGDPRWSTVFKSARKARNSPSSTPAPTVASSSR